ncbi:hypothetical protein N6H14_17445 [Paenibacillus sp. CC-CFT747]|nr:hypothetical protein N6H14_17445 [Paenibacillus sp. CC-CFT747]
MNKPLALLLACVTVALMLGISWSLSLRRPWLALGFAAATILFIGFSFILKARARRRQEANRDQG